jgi:hypothetical protein
MGLVFLKNLYLCRELSAGIQAYCGEVTLNSFDEASTCGKFVPMSSLKCWFEMGVPNCHKLFVPTLALNAHTWPLKNLKYLYKCYHYRREIHLTGDHFSNAHQQ